MPDYDKSDNDTVVLTLPGTVIDENYSLLLLENSDIDLVTTVLLDKVQKVLLQVNISGEVQKFGFDESELKNCINELKQLDGIEIEVH